MKAIISLFMLSVLSYGSVKAQSEDRYANAIKKEITQVNPGPTMVEIKDGNVMVNGEVVTTIADKSECLRLKINTECTKPKPKPVVACDPCQRRRTTCGGRCGGSDRYGYSRSEGPRSYETYRSSSYGGYYQSRGSSCGCKSHHDW